MSSKERKNFFRKKKLRPTVDEESSSSEDDQNGELLTEELEKDFLKVLSYLKKKDPKLYTDNSKFFHTEENNTAKNSVKVEEKQEEISQWLKGQKASVKVEEQEELEALHDFWSNPKLDENEQFLRDYLLDKTFLKQDDKFEPLKEIERLEEEEREVEEQMVFEEKFNYRFENLDENFLKNYPRTMEKTCGEESDNSGQEESTEEEKTEALENNKQKKNDEYKCKESVESSSESDGSEITNSVSSKIINLKKQPRKLNGILQNKRKVNSFEVTSTETKPKQAKININHTNHLSKIIVKKENDLLLNKNSLNSQANNKETTNRCNEENSKLKKLSNHIEHLKRLISQSPKNKQTITNLRINRKINHLLNTKMKKRVFSDVKKKFAQPSQYQEVIGKVFKKRKAKNGVIRCIRPSPESCMKTNLKLLAKRLKNKRRKKNRRSKYSGETKKSKS